ncbi:unnamed protein product [Polarella glacialis]|uniref:LicD/FKTN/FKRP nucleotidyltransferase domain-containing protein n=1 Tax=Polarella glacialis TaxID=89957 RepID=A0A813HB45_POLGL|nr:unnamed protein product [Polarella glacialis]
MHEPGFIRHSLRFAKRPLLLCIAVLAQAGSPAGSAPSYNNNNNNNKIYNSGSFLELQSLWSEPPWSRQPNGTVCAPAALGDLLKLQALFAEVSMLLEATGVKWLLSHGSLLGAWLHHGPIPWDEEGDILLLPEDFSRLAAQLAATTSSSAVQEIKTPRGDLVRLFQGPRVGALQFDLHEHTDRAGGWLATAFTFRLAADPRDSEVHLDAFLARTNGSHAWTDSAVLPLEVLLPARWLRFFDFLLPAPQDPKTAVKQITTATATTTAITTTTQDPKTALELWYGPRFTARRKCSLRSDAAATSRLHGADGNNNNNSNDSNNNNHNNNNHNSNNVNSRQLTPGLGQIAELSGALLAASYPMVKNEELGGESQVLRCTAHLNRTKLWAFDLDTRKGRVVKVDALQRRPRLARLGQGPTDQAEATAVDGAEYTHQGAFPDKVPNMWD